MGRKECVKPCGLDIHGSGGQAPAREEAHLATPMWQSCQTTSLHSNASKDATKCPDGLTTWPQQYRRWTGFMAWNQSCQAARSQTSGWPRGLAPAMPVMDGEASQLGMDAADQLSGLLLRHWQGCWSAGKQWLMQYPRGGGGPTCITEGSDAPLRGTEPAPTNCDQMKGKERERPLWCSFQGQAPKVGLLCGGVELWIGNVCKALGVDHSQRWLCFVE